MTHTPSARFATGLLLACLLTLSACQKPVAVKPDYDRALPDGVWALEKILSLADWPDVRQSFDGRDDSLLQSTDRSLAWFQKQSSLQFFPIGDVSHMRAQTSLWAFRQILAQSKDAASFETALQTHFECYRSVGYDGRGTVLFTGYYSPIFKGNRTAAASYQYPLYKRPSDLVTDTATGKVKGQQTANGIQSYPTRREIEQNKLLDGQELVYLPSRLDQYVIQVNGSARIDLPQGKPMYVGYAGSNGLTYTGLGQMLKAEKVLPEGGLSLPAIRAHFQKHPDDLDRYIQRNDRYVFFSEYNGNEWPAGSLGFKVTGHRSIATDKQVFPRAGIVLASTRATSNGAHQPFQKFMLDQDTGGAIRAAGRADLYMGIGPEAEQEAGGQYAEGRLYYFFLKHEKTLDWHAEMVKTLPPPKTAPSVPAAPKPDGTQVTQQTLLQ